MSERTVLGNYILLNKSIGRGAFSKIYAGYTLFSNKEDSVTRTILNRLYNARVKAQNDIKSLRYKNE